MGVVHEAPKEKLPSKRMGTIPLEARAFFVKKDPNRTALDKMAQAGGSVGTTQGAR